MRYKEQAPDVVNFFDRKLVFPGYQHQQRIRIVEGDISAYPMKPGKNSTKGKHFYLSADGTLERRNN